MKEERKSATGRADFIKQSGMGPELAEFLTEFIDEPGIFYSMPSEKRREIETQMDAVIYSFRKHF